MKEKWDLLGATLTKHSFWTVFIFIGVLMIIKAVSIRLMEISIPLKLVKYYNDLKNKLNYLN